MNEYKFGVTGKDRKSLVNAISEILNTPSVYLKTPTYAYEVGNFINIDKNGMVTGEMTADLLTALAGRGFTPERTEETLDTTESQPEAEMETPAEPMADNTPEAHESETPAKPLTDTAPEASEPATETTADKIKFTAEPETERIFTFNTPRGNFKIQAVYETAGEAEAAGYGMYFTHNDHDIYIKPSGNGEHCKLFALVGAPFETGKTAEPEASTEPITETTPDAPADIIEPDAYGNSVCIEVPLNGFTPESIDNLCKMVSAKEPLIKKALGTDALPIQVLTDRIRFPWLKPETDSAYVNACHQLITCLAKTAKKKKRVTAKTQESFENEKFALRVWLIGLGMIGSAYGETRKQLMRNLCGNSAWRFSPPDKAVGETTTPEATTEATTDITPDTITEATPDVSPAETATEPAPDAPQADAALEDETANVA